MNKHSSLGRWPTDAGMLLAASYGYDVWVPLKALGALFTSVTRQVWRQRSDYGAPAVSGLVFGLVPWLVVYLAVSAFLAQLFAIAAPAFVIQYIRAD